MLPSNPATALRTAPTSELVTLLLKQFKRLLHDNDVTMTTQVMQQLGDAVATREQLLPIGEAIVIATRMLVQESIAVLTDRFGLSFAQALMTDMNAIGGWETTAEFLEIANHKSNAELRISAGSALLAFLGSSDFVDALWAVIAEDGGIWDVDAIIAQRALCHLANVNPADANWAEDVRARLANPPTS